jgi:hypothetical protein
LALWRIAALVMAVGGYGAATLIAMLARG